MEKDNNELMNISENENLDGTRALPISDISNDFINSKIDSQKVLEQNSNIQEIEMTYDEFDIIRFACEGFRLNHDKLQIRHRVDEVLFKCPLIDKYIIGFQNQCGVIKSDNLNLFDVVKGIGSYW